MKFLKHLYLAVSIALLFFALAGCTGNKKTADQIFYNGVVYTVDSLFSIVTAFAVIDGKIAATGSDEEMLQYEAKEKTDLDGKFVYPGLHDGHCHFYGYGTDMKKIWLGGTDSFDAIIDTLKNYQTQNQTEWIFGRGWDQNDWDGKQYPDKSRLDSLFPTTPVFLLRIDGHAAVVNQAGLDKAGVTPTTKVTGGFIGTKNGKLSGLLIDNAVNLVYSILPKPGKEEQMEALLKAQDNCFAVGLTSVTDAGIEDGGLSLEIIMLIDSLQKTGDLKIRMNLMALLSESDYFRKNGKIKTPSLSVHSFKMYADGSLGSRGACLLQPYADQPGHSGFLIYSPEQLDSIANVVATMGFQLNSHCIGDSSHRIMLKIYEKYVGSIENHRWRIEHAQVIHPDDFDYYKRNKVIPSVQPVHATSDMYWAEERIGPERIKGAYAYNELLNQTGIIVSGSDFPVESINPLYGFYAAVARKDQNDFPREGFQPENKLSRENTLRSFTIWPSYAAFTENEKGSLEKGKVADFVIFDRDLMNIPDSEIYKLKVQSTYIGGKPVYLRDE